MVEGGWVCVHLPAGPRPGGHGQPASLLTGGVEAFCNFSICLLPDIVLSFSNPK